MLNFQKIYEWVFKSFRIKGSSLLVQTFEQEHVKHFMIIRRSWIYGILVSFLLLLIIGITVINIYFVLQSLASHPIIAYGIAILVVFSIVFTAYSGLVYLFYFHEIHGKKNTILDIYEWERVLAQGNAVFIRFFNRVTLSYFIYIGIMLFETCYLIFISRDYFNPGPYLDIFSFVVQIFFIAYYRSRMIDLEMDYILVIPGKIYFIDQIGVHTNIQTLQLMNNIKTIQSSYPNFLGSFFDFWTIEISLDTMMPNPMNPNIMTSTPMGSGPMGPARALHMHYVTSPIETVNNINKLLVDYDHTPLIIDTILKEMDLNGQNPNDPDIAQRIGKYLVEYEEHVKKLFTEGNPEEKNEIIRIYKKYMPHHKGF